MSITEKLTLMKEIERRNNERWDIASEEQNDKEVGTMAAQNPWNLKEFTRLRNKRWGFEVVYEYDLCYQEWLLWNGRSYLGLDNFTPDDFEIV